MPKCECCEQRVEKLVKHHWYEPPINSNRFFTHHTKKVCESCNSSLTPEKFWIYPTLDHILPSWEIQVFFVRQWLLEHRSLISEIPYEFNPKPHIIPPPKQASKGNLTEEQYKRLLAQHHHRKELHRDLFREDITAKYAKHLPMVKKDTRLIGG